MDDVVSAQYQLHREVLAKVCANRVKVRASASTGTRPDSEVEEYVMVARVDKRGELN